MSETWTRQYIIVCTGEIGGDLHMQIHFRFSFSNAMDCCAVAFEFTSSEAAEINRIPSFTCMEMVRVQDISRRDLLFAESELAVDGRKGN